MSFPTLCIMTGLVLVLKASGELMQGKQPYSHLPILFSFRSPPKHTKTVKEGALLLNENLHFFPTLEIVLELGVAFVLCLVGALARDSFRPIKLSDDPSYRYVQICSWIGIVNETLKWYL